MTTNKVESLASKRILVVEDDEPLRKVIVTILEAEGCSPVQAGNGLIAKKMLAENGGAFDFILSDVRMPEMDGLQLLAHVKETYLHIKVVIFTAFSEVLETRHATDLGAAGFLLKPFRLTDLLKVLSDIMNPASAETVPDEDQYLEEQKFCRVSVNDFLSATRLRSDVYLRLSPTKYIKIAREGTEIEIERIEVYKDRKVDYFYVLAEDFSKYSGLSLALAKGAKGAGMTASQKLQLYRHSSEILTQQIFVQGMDSELCKEAQTMAQNTLNMVAESSDLFEVLLALQKCGDQLYAHCLATAVYAGMIAKKLGWVSPANQYKLMTAGLLHDIGLKEIPADIREKPRVRMTSEEILLYETHALRGRDILQSMPEFDGDICQIIFQHHENQIGLGYPMRTSGAKIHPLARVLRVADEFSERAQASGITSLATAAPVLTQMCESKYDVLAHDALGALCEIFHVPVRPARMVR